MSLSCDSSYDSDIEESADINPNVRFTENAGYKNNGGENGLNDYK